MPVEKWLGAQRRNLRGVFIHIIHPPAPGASMGLVRNLGLED